jgi:formate-dependent nitrite reductase membrane component NrfD
LERHLGEATTAYRKKIKWKTWVWLGVVIIAIVLLVMSNVMIRKRERVVPGENEGVGCYQPGHVSILERAEVC